MGDGAAGAAGAEMADALSTLLPGWIESATHHRLLDGVDERDELEARVRQAWRAGALQHTDGLWWTPPPQAAPDSPGEAPAAERGHDAIRALVADLRRRCEEGRPDEALQIGLATTTTLVAEIGTDDRAEGDLAQLAIATVFALLDAGRVHPADAMARAGHAACIARAAPHPQGWFAAALGTTELVAGHILHARRLLSEARLLGRLTADAQLESLATGVWTLTFNMAGQAAPALIEPARTGEDTAAAALGREFVTRGPGWLGADRARLADLATAARSAADAGLHGRAAGLAGELAVLGDPITACRVFEHVGPLDGDLLPLWPRIAEALAARDAPALAALATQLDRLGIMGLSAAFTLHAAALAQDDEDAMRELLRTANRRADGLELGVQFLAQFRRLLPLRDREREIAELAAAGMTNRQIAEQLVLSVRTVENHLYRAYDKLGVEGRDDLTELLSATFSPRQ